MMRKGGQQKRYVFFLLGKYIQTENVLCSGVVVGLLNIRARETTEFLVACIALLVAGGAGLNVITWANVGIYLQAVVANITVFVAPAAVVVSIKAVIELAER